MKRLTKLLAPATLTLAAATAVPGVSFAGDSKVLPGSNCKPALGNQAANVNYFGGGITNISSFNIDVRCPVVRDITGNTNGMGAGNGGIIVRVSRGAGTAQNVTCTARAYRAFSSGIVDSHTQTLFVNLPRLFDLRLDRSEANAPYEVSCTLPPSFTIQNYQGSE